MKQREEEGEEIMYHLILAFFNEWSDVEEVQDNAGVKFAFFYGFL